MNLTPTRLPTHHAYSLTNPPAKKSSAHPIIISITIFLAPAWSAQPEPEPKKKKKKFRLDVKAFVTLARYRDESGRGCWTLETAGYDKRGEFRVALGLGGGEGCEKLGWTGEGRGLGMVRVRVRWRGGMESKGKERRGGRVVAINKSIRKIEEMNE